MVKKNENWLVIGLMSLAIALVFVILGDSGILVDFVSLVFIGIAIISGARYLVLSSLDKKRK